METAAPVLDDTDRALITELQRDGRASWNHIGRGVGIADTTASRRAQRLMGDGVVRVVGGLDPLRCNLGYPVLIRMRTSPGRIGNVLDELAVREDVRFLAVVTGTSDVVAELIVTSQQHLARVVLDELHVVEGVESTVTSTVMRHYKLSHHERPALPVGPDGRPEVAADPLDEIDHRIVGELARDGRMSVATLAANLGISESMARRRVDALISDGRVVISTLLDADALGGMEEHLATLAFAAAPGAIADAKALVDDVAGEEIDHGLMKGLAKRIAERRASDEGKEGLAAFLEKRKPNWAE